MNILLNLVVTAISLLIAAPPAGPKKLVSYNDAHDRVFKGRLRFLPQLKGVTTGDLLRVAAGLRGPLFDRAKVIFSNENDFKSEPQVKFFHPMGVCADAKWRMTHPSLYTGLFAQGTDVHALVRFSTGTDQTTYEPGQARLFGLAVKLFAGQDPSVPAPTRNIFALDQGGLEGDDRAPFFGPYSKGGPVVFSNHAAGSGLAIGAVNNAFKKIDINPAKRPTLPMAEIDGQGKTVVNALAPDRLEFFPLFDNGPTPGVGDDFRNEILSLPTGTMTFGLVGDGITLGYLEVSETTVTTACDQELNFFHPHNR